MLIDSKARPWIAGSVVVFALATGGFFYYWHVSGGHPDGGTWPGLAFGSAGFFAMLVAMLLAARKKLRSHLLGRAYYWMQAHVWFGLLSYPLILYHAGGFSWGGTLTQVLMWLFTIVFVSGIVGIILQQVIPIKLMREVPAETIAAQIRKVQQVLRDEAEAIINAARTGGEENLAETTGGGTAVATSASATVVTDTLVTFYEQKIVLFLADRFDSRSPLASPLSAQEEFSRWRSRLDPSLHPITSRLETLVDERRQLAHQRRLHSWLHGWLLVHIPLSYGLIVLAGIHSVMALRFMPHGR